jgi:hypothetical protein
MLSFYSLNFSPSYIHVVQVKWPMQANIFMGWYYGRGCMLFVYCHYGYPCSFFFPDQSYKFLTLGCLLIYEVLQTEAITFLWLLIFVALLWFLFVLRTANAKLEFWFSMYCICFLLIPCIFFSAFASSLAFLVYLCTSAFLAEPFP